MGKMILEQARNMQQKPNWCNLETEDAEIVKLIVKLWTPPEIKNTAPSPSKRSAPALAFAKHLIWAKIKLDGGAIDEADELVKKSPVQEMVNTTASKKKLVPVDLSFVKLQRLVDETKPAYWDNYHIQHIDGGNAARHISRDSDMRSAVRHSRMEDSSRLGHVFWIVEGEVPHMVQLQEWPPAVLRD